MMVKSMMVPLYYAHFTTKVGTLGTDISHCVEKGAVSELFHWLRYWAQIRQW